MDESSESRDLATAVEQLREVRTAYHRFLALWAQERMAMEPRLLDRVAADLERTRLEQRVADPFNRDWSLMYRGNVLDD